MYRDERKKHERVGVDPADAVQNRELHALRRALGRSDGLDEMGTSECTWCGNIYTEGV